MRSKFLLPFFILLQTFACFTVFAIDPAILKSKIKMSELRFIENKAQWDSRALFKVDLPIGSLFLEKAGFTYVVFNRSELNCCHRPTDTSTVEPDHMVHGYAFKVHFEGSNDATKPYGERPFPEYHNYFLGDDQAHWASKVQLYHSVTYPALYPGIDLFVGNNGLNLKYEFRLAAGADPSKIRLDYEGTEGLSVSGGNLIIKNSVDNIIEQTPYAYQVLMGDTLIVPCHYSIKGKRVVFSFPAGYRHDLPLVIDPVVVGATYAGSVNSSTYGHSATYDAAGNIFMAGNSFGQGYPVTTGSFQTMYGGSNDIGISKLNPTATTLLWATYLGGNNYDYAHSLIVNDNDELFVYGSTQSNNFPHTTGCFQPTFGGIADIFVAHFSADATSLIGSTYVGGSGSDGLNLMAVNYGDSYRGEIILDTAGNPWVSSFSSSSNFPVTPGCYDNTYNGGQDGVVFSLNDSLTHMRRSTYLGGSGDDAAYGLKLNSVNQVYVTGGTKSSNFPTSGWSYQPAFQGGPYDGFITILNDTLGPVLVASTFFGTSKNDQLFFIQMNAWNEVFVYGQTEGSIPITPGCYGNANSPQFIAKLDPSLSEVMFTTTFGSGIMSAKLTPTAFLVDVCDNIYAAGWGNTNNYPVSANALQPITDGVDFYIFALNPGATQLMYATYYGAPDTGEHVDGGTSRFDKHGKIYEAVCEGSATNFPTTPGAYADHKTVPWDLAVFVIDFQLSGPTAFIGTIGTAGGCAPFTASFSNSSLNALQYIWDFGDGSPLSFAVTPTHVYQNPGVYQAYCIAIDSTSCFIIDTAFITITVIAPPIVNLGSDTLMCGVDSLILNAVNPASTIMWSTSQSTHQITVNSPGTYWVSANNGVCIGRDTIVVTFMPKPDLGPDISLCQGLNATLSSGQPTYLQSWSTGETTTTINVNSSGTYWVGISKQTCTLYDSINVTFKPLPIIELGPTQDICEGSFATLDAGNPGSIYNWSTGLTTQQIQAGTTGLYSVTVTKQGCKGKDSVIVNAMPIPVVDLLGDRHLCANDTLYLDAGNPGYQFLWSNGATTQSIAVTTPGIVWVRVGIAPCFNYDSIYVDLITLSVDLGPDTLLCPGGTIILNAKNPGSNYLWNTGDVNQAINIKRNGTFWVKVSQYQCSVSDTIHVDLMENLNLPELLNLCGNEFLTISAGIPADSYVWSTGEATAAINVTEPGLYMLMAQKGHCTLYDSTLVIGNSGIATFYIPNSFTPNGDGVNDFFTAKGTDVTYFKMTIFNRWGEFMFETYDQEKGWDGKFQGEYVPPGEFIYVIRYATICSFDQVFQKVGSLLVLR